MALFLPRGMGPTDVRKGNAVILVSENLVVFSIIISAIIGAVVVLGVLFTLIRVLIERR